VFEQTDADKGLPPEEMLDQMVAAGYAGTELGPPGFLGDAGQLRKRLGDRGLSLVGAFLPQRFSRAEHAAADREEMVRVLELLAAGRPDDVMPKAVLADSSIEPDRVRWAGRIPEHPETALPADRFSVLIDNLHRAGEAARERGFDPVLHFHAASYIESAAEIHQVFDALDTSLVGMCLDTGHALFGGADPTALLDDYGDIVRHIHIKDCDQSVLHEVSSSGGGMMEAWDRGVFCRLGLGTAGLDGFLEAVKARGWEGWMVVEQDRFLKPEDTPEALLALHTANREWLAERGF
jgi:inosose dehydratase